MSHHNEHRPSSAVEPGKARGAAVPAPGKRTHTEALSGDAHEPAASTDAAHAARPGDEPHPAGPRSEPVPLQALFGRAAPTGSHGASSAPRDGHADRGAGATDGAAQRELAAEEAELTADESEVAAIAASLEGEGDDGDDAGEGAGDTGDELERESAQIEDESHALDQDTRATLARHTASGDASAGAARPGAPDPGARTLARSSREAPDDTAHAARARRVPDTDAEIRRIRAHWQRLRDRARRSHDRAEARKHDKVSQRDKQERRRERARARRHKAHAHKRHLKQLKARREARLAAARRKKQDGGFLGKLLHAIEQLITRAIELVKKVIAALARALALIARLARLIKKISAFLRAVVKLIARIVDWIKRAAKQIAKWAHKLADPDMRPFGFDRTGGPRGETRTERTEGVIFAEAGRNLHAQPDSGSPVVRLLGYGTHIYVQDRDVPGGWAKVTTAHGEEGYVSNNVVKTDLPCPGAKLHLVKSGETALGIAGRNFGRVEEPGHDGRFFVNVLQFVNQDSAIGDQHDWRNVKFRAGSSIWIPTPEFAHTLRGKVDDGSITNGLWARAKGAVEAVVDIAVGAVAFAAGLVEGIAFEVKDTLVGLVDLVGEVVDLIKGIFTGEILSHLKEIWNELKSIDLRSALQGFLDKWNDENPWDRWRFRGEVVGRVATEVVLAVLTSGVAAVVSGTSKFARLTAAVSHLKFVRRIERTVRIEGHELPSKLDALRTRRRPGRTERDIEAQRRSEEKNANRPGSGTPAALDWRGRSAGRGEQDKLLKHRAQQAFDDGATDIRVDQAQVGAAKEGAAVGDKLGDNRPDLQYTDRNGRRHYVEYDSYGSDRGRQHLRRILANDPDAQLELWQQIRVRHGHKFKYEYVKVFP